MHLLYHYLYYFDKISTTVTNLKENDLHRTGQSGILCYLFIYNLVSLTSHFETHYSTKWKSFIGWAYHLNKACLVQVFLTRKLCLKGQRTWRHLCQQQPAAVRWVERYIFFWMRWACRPRKAIKFPLLVDQGKPSARKHPVILCHCSNYLKGDEAGHGLQAWDKANTCNKVQKWKALFLSTYAMLIIFQWYLTSFMHSCTA